MSCLFTTLLPLHISMEKNMLIAVPPIQISEYVRLCQISLDQVGLGYVGYLGVFRLSLARFSSTIRDTVLYRVTNCIMGVHRIFPGEGGRQIRDTWGRGQNLKNPKISSISLNFSSQKGANAPHCLNVRTPMDSRFMILKTIDIPIGQFFLSLYLNFCFYFINQ